MSKHHAIALGLVFGVCLVIPAELVADVYDDFGDSSFWQGVEPNDSVYQPPGLPDPGFDPNLWDMDDPHWTFYPLVCSNPYAEIITGEYADRALRVYADADPLIGKYAFMAAALEGPDPDPNTSTTHWDDTTDHYMLALCYVGGGYEDPNDDRGRAALIMHGNPAVWQAMALLFDFDEQIGEGDAYPHTHLIGLETGNGTEWKILVRVFIDPNAQHTGDPCDFTIYEPSSYNYLDDPKWQGADINQWEREGIWLLYQFEHDPNFQSGDPNGKFVRGTIWKGDKYDWDGTWLLECECSGPTYHPGDPMEWYWSSGLTTVAAWSGITVSNGFPADQAYDNFEIRTGLFTNTSRSLTLKMKDCCDLGVEPDVLKDPNQDPNDFGVLRRYTDGTAIVLDAVVPCGNKVFKKWTVKGPNDSGDPLYQVVTDTNETVYLTMDGDYLVKATCKCGGGGIEPFAGMVLFVLALGVAVRRAL